MKKKINYGEGNGYLNELHKSSSQTPTYTPPPMPEVKLPKVDVTPLEVSRETYNRLRDEGLLNPNVVYIIKEKQRTVLSVRDFVILYNMANNRVMEMESQALRFYAWEHTAEPTEEMREKARAKKMEQLRQNLEYQDLLRIRDKLGELNIEIETPRVEVEEDE